MIQEAEPRTDLLLIHPPQWSPFQPPLSLPSLTAWLAREGFRVRGRDLNLSFYEWLLSDDCARLLIRKLEGSGLAEARRSGYRAVFESAADYRRDIRSLKSCGAAAGDPPAEDIVKRHYFATKSLESYLMGISELYADFAIYPYDFRLTGGNLNVDVLERMIAHPPDIFQEFLEKGIEADMERLKPRIVGISCLGQEQLYVTFLLGQLIKRRWQLPVMVGGTFFSRIFERGTLGVPWFNRYFDFIVRHEGEIPCQKLLANCVAGRPLERDVPNLVYRQGEQLVATPLCPPLRSEDVPTPCFDDLPLDRYFSAQLTLPVLASRGCYWGHCEFCRHGMVYGGNYNTYTVEKVLDTVKLLAAKYRATQFCFHDESIPPEMLKEMGRRFPAHRESGWTFSGDLRFENSLGPGDFKDLFRIGFRSFHVGLESGSERVLRLMKKHAAPAKETMVANLAGASDAGIWMHCFLFFGFPGETDADARETLDFVLANADRIGCFGCGTYVLEHNSPLYRHTDDFGVRVLPGRASSLDVFHEYEVAAGLTPARALEWMKRLAGASNEIPKYHAVCWIPREQYLCLLAKMGTGQVIRHGRAIREFGGLPKSSRLSEFVSLAPDQAAPDCLLAVNRLNGRVIRLAGNAAKLVQLFHAESHDLEAISQQYPPLMEWMSVAHKSERTTIRSWVN